jgi:gas vesicle protein GvpN
MRDNYIRSVLKTDESMTSHWVDNRLTIACQHGLVLIYDEFTRSRPEANNVLLSVLEERILPLPTSRGGGESYLKVHPDFTAIFTSNPEEYAGVYRSQDALRDRMVTIEVGNFDEETEIAITQAKSGVSPEDARRIVSLVRKVREAKSNKLTPTVRACIIMGKVLKLREETVLGSNHIFGQTCLDILMPEVPREEREEVSRVIDDALAVYF